PDVAVSVHGNIAHLALGSVRLPVSDAAQSSACANPDQHNYSTPQHSTPPYEAFSEIFFRRSAISIAARAASQPLLPAFAPARSIACSSVSVVSTPKMTGILDSSATRATPVVTAPAI